MSGLTALLALSAVALLFPILVEGYRRRARIRRAHQGGCSHWYTNFDESLEYEPRHKNDIERVFIEDLRGKGYRPTELIHRIPRTFRGKIPGDKHMQLWRSNEEGAIPHWVCTPVRKKR